MTRKDFEIIAEAIRTLPVSAGVGSRQRPWIALHFAHALAATNPRFDRARFERACLANDKPGDPVVTA